MILYDVGLRISYDYDHPAEASRQLVRLVPADLPGEQRLIAGALTVRPKPEEWVNHIDFFGNKFVELAFREAHREVSFSVQSRVERTYSSPRPEFDRPLAGLGDDIAASPSVSAHAPHHFLGPSDRVPVGGETTDYARAATARSTGVMQAIAAIGTAIHNDMTYDPEATDVDTPTESAFAGRHGVCQDYSHIMIACLRGIGIPAGYVSGFLRTLPPPGQERLEGADAMHAWVRAWCGLALGWVEYDPTNDIFVNENHIVVARGRDYSDVAPVKGMLRSSGAHTSQQAVDVVPVG